MLTSAITTPATAGPMKRAALKMIELIASAEGSASRSTRVGISASRAGWAMPLIDPEQQHQREQELDSRSQPVQTRIASRVACDAAVKLGDADDPDPVAPVGENAGERLRKQHRQELGHRDEPEPGAGMGQGPGEPADRHPLHPGCRSARRRCR